MTWTDVDGVRDHLGGRDRISRKAVYNLVARGMKVAYVGTARHDSRGRLRRGRMHFAIEWVEEFMQQHAESRVVESQQPIAAVSAKLRDVARPAWLIV